MGLFDKLFKKKKPSISPEDAAKLLQLLQAQQAAFQQGAQNKERNTPISQEELMQIFAAYFAPNTDFYAVPGSEKFTAYFQVVNAATEEMQRDLPIFKAATKWTPEQLADLLNNPKPGITSSLICGLRLLWATMQSFTTRFTVSISASGSPTALPCICF